MRFCRLGDMLTFCISLHEGLSNKKNLIRDIQKCYSVKTLGLVVSLTVSAAVVTNMAPKQVLT